MKKTKQPFSAIFFQQWETFTNETLVCVGVSKEEILQFMKRSKVKDDLIDLFNKVGPQPGVSGFVWTPKNTGCTLLWLDSFNGRERDMFTLIHETNHLIYDISRDKGYVNEPELQAHQQEFLFKQIWHELQKRYKKFGVKSSTTKEARHGNKDTSGGVVDLHDLSHSGGVASTPEEKNMGPDDGYHL
jgi:hypothetical protein